jgi:hypothetical protein
MEQNALGDSHFVGVSWLLGGAPGTELPLENILFIESDTRSSNLS